MNKRVRKSITKNSYIFTSRHERSWRFIRGELHIVTITKSELRISKPKLVEAYRELDRIQGEQLGQFAPKKTTIVAMLCGGIFFVEVMYIGMD